MIRLGVTVSVVLDRIDLSGSALYAQAMAYDDVMML